MREPYPARLSNMTVAFPALAISRRTGRLTMAKIEDYGSVITLEETRDGLISKTLAKAKREGIPMELLMAYVNGVMDMYNEVTKES